jgi:hypothetical protein
MFIPSKFRIFLTPRSKSEVVNTENKECLDSKCIEYRVPENIDNECSSIQDLYEVKPEIFNGSDEYNIEESKKYPVLFSIDTENKFISETRNLDVFINQYLNKDRTKLSYLVVEIENHSLKELEIIEIPNSESPDNNRTYTIQEKQKVIFEYSKKQLDNQYKNLKFIIKGDNYSFKLLFCFDLQ